ncbi:FG-GAP-like repeat-containing protein [Streptomyces sp. 15-116A]|uniref:FG-GAP-like repeat-containing protein n=1 Tax=Streptomyces sp. 15-116A TaxID=2259035 RepID=UPI0021B2703F|nr:FG-GAP-like repeat-containing protein [Streptomyces sp. 15-116A]MCT7352359.1 FG-GAP-like repeat-containing protein [Streptomyces sp. 15-116A]
MAARSPRLAPLARPVRLALATGVALVAGALVVPAVQAAPAQGADVGSARPHADFNGDGYADLAVAAPGATVGGSKGAGYVAVLYGSAHGLDTGTRQVLSQNTAGVPGGAEKDDAFGSALATADLDRDGYADLVVGVSGEDTADGGAEVGLVEVVWGGPGGLSGGAALASGRNLLDQLGIEGRLTTGDVDGDGDMDVVTVERLHDPRVLKGPFGRDGAAAQGEQVVRDEFDTRVLDLATGDVNGDGVTDLVAAQIDNEEFDARRVAYWRGSRAGLTPYRDVEGSDGYRLKAGENLDVGDVNADGIDDIVSGRAVDGYDSDLDTPLPTGGRVTWIPGTPDGPDGTRAVHLNQDSPGVPGSAERGDGFGTDVRIADVDGDGFPDVATGLPGEDLGAVKDAGAVVVLRGTASGLTGAGARAVTQNTANVPGTAETTDAFGRAVRLGDTDGDGLADLAAGAPGENTGAGSVWYFRSSPATVVTPNGTTTFGAGTLGTDPSNARLGAVLAD